MTRHLVELFLDLRIGGTPQQHELAAAVEGAVRGVLDEVDALLVREAADDTNDGAVSVPVEAHALPQGLPCAGLSLHHRDRKSVV